MKFIRNILKGASLTTALFIFQACYGTYGLDFDLEDVNFKIVSSEDGAPIKGVSVSLRESTTEGAWHLMGYSDNDGQALCTMIINDGEKYNFRFEDEKATYAVKDTVITLSESEKVIEVVLEKKN